VNRQKSGQNSKKLDIIPTLVNPRNCRIQHVIIYFYALSIGVEGSVDGHRWAQETASAIPPPGSSRCQAFFRQFPEDHRSIDRSTGTKLEPWSEVLARTLARCLRQKTGRELCKQSRASASLEANATAPLELKSASGNLTVSRQPVVLSALDHHHRVQPPNLGRLGGGRMGWLATFRGGWATFRGGGTTF
jgi:hypothetical protein